MEWLSGILASGTSSVAVIDDPTSTVYRTLLNGVSAIDAWQAGALLSAEALNLRAVEALPLSIDPTLTTYLADRVASVAAAASGIAALPPAVNPVQAVSLLQQGQPAVGYSGYLEWCMTFDAEPIPPVADTVAVAVSGVAAAWLDIANAVGVLQGDNRTTAYDTAARMYRCSAVVAANVSNVRSGPFATDGEIVYMTDELGNPLYDENGNLLYTIQGTVNQATWNAVGALPAILLDASSLASSPATLINQQTMSIRYALVQQALSLAALLLSLRIHNVTQPSTAYLRNSESLADLAARTTGNFEDWPALAALNRISPPFPGPSNMALALSGRQLFTSNGTGTPGVLPDPDSSGVSYAANVLGVDWDWGPINGTQPAWTGDLRLITGYLNFARSIGRRLQTTLGTLIYHTNYGSRIPPEVGAVQSIDEAPRLLQYGRSAILADPRTGSILTARATTEPGFLATFSATIEPIGPGATPVSVLETIGATP